MKRKRESICQCGCGYISNNTPIPCSQCEQLSTCYEMCCVCSSPTCMSCMKDLKFGWICEHDISCPDCRWDCESCQYTGCEDCVPLCENQCRRSCCQLVTCERCNDKCCELCKWTCWECEVSYCQRCQWNFADDSDDERCTKCARNR